MTKLHDRPQLPAWQALVQHQKDIASLRMVDCFLKEPSRFSRFSLQVDDLLLDYSRHQMTETTLNLLAQLALACDLPTKMNALFSGEKINTSERRAALHSALRMPNEALAATHPKTVAEDITRTRQSLTTFADNLTSDALRGCTGKPFRYVVTIGIGGSYQGPRLAIEALKEYKINDLEFLFLSTVDEQSLSDVKQHIDPETTLFIISSKTFTTLETITNAVTLAKWMKCQLGEAAILRHFVAVTANPERAKAFGIPNDAIFPFWDWVGGRYSVWSAISLPLLLSIGKASYAAFLEGAYTMDRHFQTAPLLANMPVLLALISVWYNNFFHTHAEAIIPYAHRLRYLIPYLQQAVMESNGKGVTQEGRPVTTKTSPVIFGEEGCNGQHTYHQLLHQGKQLIPADFILVGPANQPSHHQDVVLASALSQAEALMRGKTRDQAYQECLDQGYDEKTAEWLAPHKVIPGNKPCNLLYLSKLNPRTLGALLALYEHKIFVQGVIWDINSFDQWGVELGKQLLPNILNELTQTTTASSIGILQHILKERNPS